MTALTLWFVDGADPATTLTAGPEADRGFGRKYLAQLNPAWPVSLIGTFSLNRSAPASRGEFYIGGYPGLVVVHTYADNLSKLSELPDSLLHSAPAERVLAVVSDPERGFGGYAIWHDGQLHRSLCAEREWIIEDVGLPEPFEAPYWAGEISPQLGGLALPFDPADLVDGAQREWLGVAVDESGPDIEVVGYAVDGRAEPKVAPRRRRLGEIIEDSATKLNLGDNRADYDDYAEEEDPDRTGAEFQRWLDSTGALLRRAGQKVRKAARKAAEKIRYSDR